jgi:hypothetical protein
VDVPENGLLVKRNKKKPVGNTTSKRDEKMTLKTL